MTFLPIVERELRVLSRRRQTHYRRCGMAALALLLFLLLWLTMTNIPLAYVGRSIFSMVAGLVFLMSLISGILLTADAISMEKRENTLGLLFLTDLQGYDVVFGKLVATSFTEVCAILATLPILGFTVFLGGVSLQVLLCTAAAILNTLFFSLSCGLLASVWCRLARHAYGLALLLLLLFTLGWPLVLAFWLGSYPGFSIETAFMASPGLALVMGLDLAQRGFSLFQWGYSLLTVHALAWCFLGLASRRVTRIWKDKGALIPGRSWRGRLHEFWWGRPAWRARHRKQLLDRNPVFWLTSRERWKTSLPWVFLGAYFVAWITGWWRTGSHFICTENHLFTALILSLVLKLWMATEAGLQWGPDRRAGALELLLVTPVAVEEILRGQWLSLRRQFARPMVVLLALHLVFLAVDWHQDVGVGKWLALSISLVGDALALPRLAMWLSLRQGRAEAGSGSAVLLILGGPWIVLSLFLLGNIILVDWLHLLAGNPQEETSLAVWTVASVGSNLIWYGWAGHHLRTRFRQLAVLPNEPKPR